MNKKQILKKNKIFDLYIKNSFKFIGEVSL